MIKTRLYIIIFISLGLFVACLPKAGVSPTPITPLQPSPLPGFLADIYPKQGAILPVAEYITGPKDVALESSVETSAVCVLINGSRLIDIGDFWEFDDVYERTTILIDNQLADKWLGEFDYIGYISMTDEKDNEVASVGGPYQWCVSTPSSVGVHQVDVNFEKSNGEIVSYAWTFELINGPMPTPSLSTSVPVDRKGQFPDFLINVYPSPGARITKEERQVWAESPYSHLIRSPEVKPICITVDEDKVTELGTLAGEGEFFGALFNRIYIQVDGNMLQKGYIYGDEIGLNHCTTFVSSQKEHIATVYVDPFDAEIVAYSWTFTIEE